MTQEVPRVDPFMKLLECSAYRLWQATINNQQLRRLQRELENPQAGDYVLETSTLTHVGYDHLRFGTLIRVDTVVDPETRKAEPVYVIRTLAGQEVPWRRAKVIKVLTTLWGR